MTYRERREAKAERLRDWADKREVKADAASERVHAIADNIPFGQPILKGHHSQRRAERDQDTITRNMGKMVENSRKASDFRSRAGNIESALDNSIYSDDPDAVDALKARIASLEAQRDQIKADNAAFRTAHKVELKTMTAYERGQALPHAAYELTNLSSNIKRNKDRLVLIERDQARALRSEMAGGLLIEQLQGGYVSITFSEKPSREILDALRGAEFSWRRGSWWGKSDAIPDEIQQ